MNDDSAAIVPTPRRSTLGDRIRNIATQLRQEDEIQIHATSRILGAAAKLAENHDRLIDEVVEMVEEDLDKAAQTVSAEPYMVEKLKEQFSKLNEAKSHFGIKASSWAALANKLNERCVGIQTPQPQTVNQHQTPVYSQPDAQAPILHRLTAIEQELQAMRGDMNRMLQLLEQVAGITQN